MPGTVIVDGKPIAIEGEKNLLDLVRKSGVDLPTFCYVSELSVYGACRMCLVEDARGLLQPACSVQPADGMAIKTNTPRVQRSRRMMLELLLANHDRDCTTCPRNGNCKLQELATRFGVNKVRFGTRTEVIPLDETTPSLVRDPNKCILCGDCVRMCGEVQGIGAIDFAYRGASAQVLPAFGKGLGDVDCVLCGQCVAVCPTGSLTVKSETKKVWKALRDTKKKVFVQMAPAVRVAIGEEFGYAPGAITTGKAVAALRRLGFDQVYDTSWAADLTTMEETNEFVTRLLNRQKLPQFTSCCPAWVKTAEQYYPNKLEQLSTCKSPQQMFGALVKTHYAKEIGASPEEIFFVAVMPCTAKKFEAERPEFAKNGVRDVDAVISTQELAAMIKEAGIDFGNIEEEGFDTPFGFATGGGVIFGSTGGVATAAVRQAALQLDGKRITDVAYRPVEGQPGVKAAEVEVQGNKVRVAIVSGLANARRLIASLDAGEVEFDLVEVMACPNGCIGGGGQPWPNETTQRLERIKGIKSADVRQQVRVAQDNPIIIEAYRKWLGKPNGHAAHEALHTTYGARRRIVGETLEVTTKSNGGACNGCGGEAARTAPIDVSVCVGTSCYLRGSREILQRITEEVQSHNLGSRVNLKASFCFENCSKGPTVQVNGEQHSGVKVEDVAKLLENALDKAVSN